MDKKKENNDTMTESEVLTAIQRVFPIQYVNSKGNRVGEVQTILKGKLPTDNTSGVNYLLYNIFKYVNDNDKDSKDGKDFFPYYDTDKPVTVIKYKTKDQEKIEKEEQEETYKEIEKLFDNLKILKKEFGELQEGKDNSEEIKLSEIIKTEIKGRIDTLKEKKGISDYEKREEQRKILTIYYKEIYKLLKEMNQQRVSENGIIKRGGKKMKKNRKSNIKHSKKNKKSKVKNKYTIRKCKKI